MKKITFICMAILGIVAMIACEPKNVKPDYEKQIAGNWEVKTYYHWYHDFTDENLSFETSVTLPDANYQGYDSIEFKTDGTSRWHMTDLWVQQSMFDDSYRTLNWQIVGDTLIVDFAGKFAIKELNNENLVIEQYRNNGHEEYSHHHSEQIHRYTLKRVQ